jgi:hypothetical protein
MDEYEGERNWKRITLVLSILVVIAFSIYHLFLQPKPEDAGPVEPPAVNKCDPFPAEIDGYVCRGIDQEEIIGHNSPTVCKEYNALDSCISQIQITPKEIYMVDYVKLTTKAHLEYLLVIFEEKDHAERLFEEKLKLTEDLCLNASESEENRECVNISIEGVEGFYLEENLTSKYMQSLLLLDGSSLMVLANECTLQEDLLSLHESKELIIGLKGGKTGL